MSLILGSCVIVSISYLMFLRIQLNVYILYSTLKFKKYFNRYITVPPSSVKIINASCITFLVGSHIVVYSVLILCLETN